MKLLFDENLSPRLIEMLEEIFPESTQVHHCGLGQADDATIWEYAKSRGFTIVSKDSDFYERSVQTDSIPKVIWLRMPNCSTEETAEVLRLASKVIRQFIATAAETCLILRRPQK